MSTPPPSSPTPAQPAGESPPDARSAALAQAGLVAVDALPLGPSFLQQVRAEPALDATLTRSALRALARWQAAVPPAGLRRLDAQGLQRELDAFARLAHGRQGGAPWTDAQHKGWQRASGALLQSALAQPGVPLHGDCTLACFHGTTEPVDVTGFANPMVGPLTWDLATLLRDPRRPLDEATELDHAIRYWDALRRSGLPLDDTWASDFGEFWRACEWMAMLQHLGRIGRMLDGPGSATPDDGAALLAWGTRVAMRYRPLQPLVSLIEPWTGDRPASAFTF
jgi:N-acetylmuramate 1-kinase